MKQSKPTKIYVLRLKREEVAMIAESLHLVAQVAAQNDEGRNTLDLMELKEKILKQASKGEEVV